MVSDRSLVEHQTLHRYAPRWHHQLDHYRLIAVSWLRLDPDKNCSVKLNELSKNWIWIIYIKAPQMSLRFSVRVSLSCRVSFRVSVRVSPNILHEKINKLIYKIIT